MKLSYILFGLALATLIDLSVQWRGNVCSRTVCSYRQIRVCAYRTWRGCCAWKYIWAPDYRTIYFCCSGWTTSNYQNCDRPICRPNCVSGRCVRPNVCVCADGAVGISCNTFTCNYKRPCFPGDCVLRPGSDPVCTCDTGFSSPSSLEEDYCRELKADQKPEIYEVSARLSFYMRIRGQPAMEKYSIYVDSTMSDVVDEIWTNRPMYNWLNVTASGHYMTPDNYTVPAFIEDYAIGIAMADVHILHQKIALSGVGYDVVENLTRSCSPEVTSQKPVRDTYFCLISNQTVDTAFNSGDSLKITFKVDSGGYRSLQQVIPNQDRKDVQIYEGHRSEKSMAFQFDFEQPNHACLNATITCRDMFQMDEDVTKDPLFLRWSGWNDVPSGMYRYAWEVFELKVDGNLVLREPDPLGPIKGPIEVNQSSSNTNFFSAIYRPPRPGVYSVILEASDKANNSLFIRRIALYDPDSQITIDSDPERGLYASSANPVGDFTWQQNPQADVVFTWKNHFANLVHEEGKWLNKVLAYPPELEDFIKHIDEKSDQDDHEGSRTIDEIPNRRAIVKFEVQWVKESNKGENQSLIPTGTWTDVGLNETFTINGVTESLTKADTVTFWVRATDAMGNEKVDRKQVRFDDTPSNYSTNATFTRNHQVHGVPYSSSVTMMVFDMESGMKRVDVSVYMAGTDILVNNFTMPIPSKPQGSNCDLGDLCYCTPNGCFDKQQILAVSNCLLWVAKDLKSDQSVTLAMDFRNMAGLSVRKIIQIDNVAELNGTRTYIGPKNLAVTNVGETTATVSWTHSQSCYERTEMWINYREDGELKMTQLHHSATSHNLAGLKPGTSYTIELISQYGDVKSDPVPINITTLGGGLGAGAIAGIVIGVLLFFIIVILILGFVLFKLGLLAGVVGNRSRAYRHEPQSGNMEANIVHATAAKQNNRKSRWAFENTTYQKDDDIYTYGSMDLGEPWYIEPDDITLIEEIATGRFAKIYKAKYKESSKNVKEVAAKVLQDRSSEDAILLMLAKINFHATQVGEHRNLIAFIGAVMENDALGPVMVLEYCETGQLDKWLVKQRSNVSEDVFDRIQNFSLEIARAMEYLANKGIVHRKLAARNVLLTFLLEVKVTGFGPCRSDESQDDGKGDRIPVKWTAPECLKSLKQANEKSDVWSYGITIWEIFSMGGSPYSDIRGRDLPTKVKGGYRLPRPEYAEDLHYRIMQDCWSDAPASRPVFRNIVDNLENSFGLNPANDQNYYYQR